ncbi:MAG TPA: alpha/beta fold hydrolase [Anaerolineales bacterium]|nr:alpha/beta fold hydrolase [Anaerolineales bacterium]
MDDARLHVLDYPSVSGRSSAVVLLHGLGSSAQDWLFQILPLTAEHRVLAIDLPGHGATPPAGGWPSISNYAACLAATMEAAHTGPVHLVGLSLGGTVALQTALDYPERVRSLSLINTFARLQLTLPTWLQGAMRMGFIAAGRMDQLGHWVSERLFPMEDQALIREVAAVRIGSTPREGYLQSVSAVARFNVVKRLGEIRVPTLVVAGSRDRTVPMRASQVLAERIPGARLSVLEGAGHAASVDAADRLNALLVEFLGEVDSPRIRGEERVRGVLG